MSKHRAVVTHVEEEVRPTRYPDGHWMNRYWGTITRVVMALSKFPFYRYIPRMEPGAREVLASDQPVVFACTHQDIFDCFNGLPRVLPDRKITAMVSMSRDGDLSTMALTALGFDVVRGSSSRGGGEGLLMLRSSITSGKSVIMVCDGPKAPLGDVKPGVAYLASCSNAPIVPFRAWGLNRLRSERSWTKASLTIPFLPVVICFGNPIEVPERMGDGRPYQLAVAQSLARLAAAASEWAGGPARAPFSVAAS